ncbi:uncharacterized protein LOC128724820 [Anopheles nili]|uniref:uncharacterized protein LOC128724820 n=1 Tax=Anopheles nili TaxID=185578 RepID=UPI00237BBEAF|nr:uncharacterized protein LOC128724820 [Anopheles nili]
MEDGASFSGSLRWLLLAMALLSLGVLETRAQPPEALNYPNVITFGVYSGTICYSNTVNVKTAMHVTTRSFTFVPATALLYVICYNNLKHHPFEAQLVGGGLGATTQTSIVLTSSSGKLYVNCDAYCK